MTKLRISLIGHDFNTIILIIIDTKIMLYIIDTKSIQPDIICYKNGTQQIKVLSGHARQSDNIDWIYDYILYRERLYHVDQIIRGG